MMYVLNPVLKCSSSHSLERDPRPGVVSFRGDDRSQLEVHLSGI